jgi:hypothetical protein
LGTDATIASGLFETIGGIPISTSADKILTLKRIRYNAGASSALRVLLQRGTVSWTSSSNVGDEIPNAALSNSTETALLPLFVYIKNTGASTNITSGSTCCWLDLAIE